MTHNDFLPPPKLQSLKQFGQLKYFTTFCFIVFCYYIAGKLSLTLASINNSASPFWPASGIALSALVIFGWQFTPAVFLGALLTNLNTGVALLPIIGISVGNTAEAVVGTFLINYFLKQDTFKNYKEPVSFLFVGTLACAISASMGVFVLYLSGSLPLEMTTYTFFNLVGW